MKDKASEGTNGKSFDCYVLTEFFMKVEAFIWNGERINPIHGQNQVSYGWFSNKMKYILFNNS